MKKKPHSNNPIEEEISEVLSDIDKTKTALVINEFDTMRAIRRTNQFSASGYDYITQPMLTISNYPTAKFWTIVFQL